MMTDYDSYYMYDPYGRREYFNQYQSNPNVRNGREYVENCGEIRTREEYEYSFSPYYIGKSDIFSEFKKNSEWYYSDRMFEWDVKKYRKAVAAATKANGGEQRRPEQWSRQMNVAFIEKYFGKGYVWVATAMGANFATGYEYYIFMIAKKPKKKKSNGKQAL